VKRILVLIAGYTFLVLGVLGLFLPFLQGFLFLFIGLVLLSREAVWARWLLVRGRRRYPDAFRKADEAHRRFQGWVDRMLHRLGFRRTAVPSTEDVRSRTPR
jgi:hypothetical protein